MTSGHASPSTAVEAGVMADENVTRSEGRLILAVPEKPTPEEDAVCANSASVCGNASWVNSLILALSNQLQKSRLSIKTNNKTIIKHSTPCIRGGTAKCCAIE